VARGTGANTTELLRVDGVLLNAVAITNGPAASRGLYVGTIATDAAGKLNMMFRSAAAAGGTNNRIDIWNHYNRQRGAAICRDSTDSWAMVAGAGVMRAANNSLLNRVTIVRGLDEGAVQANGILNGSFLSNTVACGIGIDSATIASGVISSTFNPTGSGWFMPVQSRYSDLPGLGSHAIQFLEYSVSGGPSNNWFGDNGTSAIMQSGLHVEFDY
jgi:hypothetical protein